MNKLKLSGIATGLLVLLGALSPVQTFAAGTAFFALSPTGVTVNAGSTLAVGVYENGTDVNVVTANKNILNPRHYMKKINMGVLKLNENKLLVLGGDNFNENNKMIYSYIRIYIV